MNGATARRVLQDNGLVGKHTVFDYDFILIKVAYARFASGPGKRAHGQDGAQDSHGDDLHGLPLLVAILQIVAFLFDHPEQG